MDGGGTWKTRCLHIPPVVFDLNCLPPLKIPFTFFIPEASLDHLSEAAPYVARYTPHSLNLTSNSTTFKYAVSFIILFIAMYPWGKGSGNAHVAS